jgi:phenylalanyl-tRNA synthetase beta chain
MAGLEVEAVIDRYDYLKTVVVGKIVSAELHPRADRLTVCRVDIGDQTVPIVCGAPNAAADMLAPTALPGTLLPDGKIIETAEIRGETSQGMLCSEGELDLGPDFSGLMALHSRLTPGTPLTDALGITDTIFEIGLTPNRADCLSVLGVAREAGAVAGLGRRVRPPSIQIEPTGESIHEYTSVTVEAPDHCPRYTVRLVKNVRVAPSPFWLRERLMSVGIRPVNNIVDVTNFVMMETGQPLHAFDYDRLADHRIVVRTAAAGERFTTLDDKDRSLQDHMLMICDGEKPVGIGGVMGGLNSEIDDTTRNVLIESAYFAPGSIRKTARALNLHTDASHRFERGVDPHGTVYALDRAAQLMAETIGGAEIVGGVIDIHPHPAPRKTVRLPLSEVPRHLGLSLDRTEIVQRLESVDFNVQDNGEDSLAVEVPTFRVDITRPIDLIEEIARLAGYHRIPTTFPPIPATVRTKVPARTFRDRIRDLLLGIGFTEVISYVFARADHPDTLRFLENDPRRRTVRLRNPLSEAHAVLRTSLFPGLLETAGYNLARQARRQALFETGRIYIDNGPGRLPDEPEYVAALLTGDRSEPSWHTPKPERCDFYDIKGALETLLDALLIDDARFTALPEEECRTLNPGHAARISVNGDTVGVAGAVHPVVLKHYDPGQPVFLFEINLAALSAKTPAVRFAPSIPRYPATSRDVTLIVDRGVEAQSVIAAVLDVEEPLIEDVGVFGVFEGKQLPEGKKSISFRITYRSSAETLEDETVTRIHREVASHLLQVFNAEFPADT